MKGISFSLKKGDSLGIVGLNGAGKSTLLKLISGIMEPTAGSIETEGIIAPLIELGGGFYGDMSARENIYLTGSMHGLSRRYLKEREQEIIQFAELEEFADVPVRNFSSGMRSRLGFAIATAIQPDILIMDEVLSVGDAKFRSKSIKRIEQIIESGATVLFVSHGIDQVDKICSKALWLDHGHMKMFGESREVCAQYKEFCARTD